MGVRCIQGYRKDLNSLEKWASFTFTKFAEKRGKVVNLLIMHTSASSRNNAGGQDWALQKPRG